MGHPDPYHIPWPDDDAAIRDAAYWIIGNRLSQPPPKTRADLRRQEAQILEDEYDAIRARIGALVLENAPQILLVAAMVQARMIFCRLIEAWQEYAREAELERNAQAMARAVDQWNSHIMTDRSSAHRPSDIAPTAFDLWRKATTGSWPQYMDPEP